MPGPEREAALARSGSPKPWRRVAAERGLGSEAKLAEITVQLSKPQARPSDDLLDPTRLAGGLSMLR